MSRNDIAKMSVEERIALMEELWISFDRDGLEYPVPQWHKEVLAQRAKSKEKDFISMAELKKSLQAELNDA
ncbi:hypothetical protein MNB_SV-4-1124 [hydrothermal vent metagenome]|uniref:Addiction module component n=1 Tax=hydrothermal vent metagenome TaxID=652676 RepID=A0A1W1E942_9ZZZZ